MTYRISWKQTKRSLFHEQRIYQSFIKAALAWLGLRLIRRADVQLQVWSWR